MRAESASVPMKGRSQLAFCFSHSDLSIQFHERCESDREDFEEEPNSEDDDAAATVTADPPGVRQNALVKTGITQFETSTAGEESKSAGEGKKATGEEKEAGKVQRKNPSFAGLFTGNRMPTEDSKLEFFNQDEEMAIIELEDIQESDFHWERCLIGYFSGRFPGKQALRQITNSWKVQVTVKHHGSGWLIFQFSSDDDKVSVLGNGPYIIYGRPLLLKPMPRLFKFGNEAISCFPVWVQLRYVPLDMTMGHTEEGCKVNKAAKPNDVVTEKGKETEAAAAELNDQTGTSGAGTKKGNQLEWVTKKTKAGKGQKEITEVRTAETQTCNKFSPLEVSPETEEILIQKFGPEVEVEETQNQTLGTEPATEKNQNVDPSLESEKEGSSRARLPGRAKSLPRASSSTKKKCRLGKLHMSSQTDRVQVQS
ncbi:hypothetical protein Acr_24g0000220 [Actinidia rufa]|uniref:DUF4283 domain-containing protein n=1 Tax=Actinidia rufa TaxID=165716 RepID=A0A7J0GSR9_9ERIC|nr:hypothetical protein Acr_24g0000220 [Actinidia rufa]